jgi:prolyl-tRNA synthetase
MSHGDDSGLVLPPKIAPVQIVIIPVAQHKEGVLEKAGEIRERLEKAGFRVKLDDSDNSAGWKFAEYEMKGVPLRLEIGPKDIEQNQCVIVRRDTREKSFINLDDCEQTAQTLLNELSQAIYEKSLSNIAAKTYTCSNIDEIIDALSKNGDGFVKAMWCGSEACEDEVKEKSGVGSRCIPLEQEAVGDKCVCNPTCVCCGEPAESLVYWGKAY